MSCIDTKATDWLMHDFMYFFLLLNSVTENIAQEGGDRGVWDMT